MATIFDYTGGVQTYVVPETGLYQLDVWGARGGYYWRQGGIQGAKGGHSRGYKLLQKDTILYVCVGGVGANSNGGDTTGHDRATALGGYNGGGNGNNAASGGGGATHIALVNGTLAQIGENSFLNLGNGLIVAGGGGGEGGYERQTAANNSFVGGVGGGLNGLSHGTSSAGNLGATQSIGYAFGQGGALSSALVSQYNYHCGGGGGGLYGGLVLSNNGGAGGGSGYVGGVPEISYKGGIYMPLSEAGVWDGNGRAEIELLVKGSPTVKLGNLSIDDAKLGARQVEAIYLGSQPLE